MVKYDVVRNFNVISQHFNIVLFRSWLNLSAGRCYLIFKFHMHIFICFQLMDWLTFKNILLVNISSFEAFFGIGLFFEMFVCEGINARSFLLFQHVCSDAKSVLNSVWVCSLTLKPRMLLHLLQSKPITGLKSKHLGNEIFEVFVEVVFAFSDRVPAPKLVHCFHEKQFVELVCACGHNERRYSSVHNK